MPANATLKTRVERLALQHLLTRLPDAVLVKLGGGAPVTVAGRTLHPLLQFMMHANRNARPMETMTPVQAREAYGQIVATAAPEPAPMHTVDDWRIPVTGATIRARRYVPPAAAATGPGVLLFHGGGHVIGDIDQYDATAREIAARLGCAVLNVDYRCAPEHRFPVAAEDCIAAWVWAQEHAAVLGMDPARMAVMGDSAGGNLSAVVALAARDRKLPSPKAQCLVYPVVDVRLVSPSIRALGQGFGLTEPLIHWFAGHYVPDESQRTNPLVSPLLADSHANLAPAVVTVAGFDPLHDEGIEYANTLRAAGVPVTLLEHDDLIHAWFTMTGAVPPAAAAMAETCNALRRLLA
jgi:acetyl esterase